MDEQSQRDLYQKALSCAEDCLNGSHYAEAGSQAAMHLLQESMAWSLVAIAARERAVRINHTPGPSTTRETVRTYQGRGESE